MQYLRVISIIVLSLITYLSYGQSDIQSFLESNEDITVESIKTGDDGVTKAVIYISQPVNHQQPNGDTFGQRIILTHVGMDMPTVIQTQGYNVSDRENEIVKILNGNSINVEHRYFAKSVPEPRDWTYLTLEQATADLHKIRTLFGEIYTDKWVATGISKGGATTIYYEYFYPEDTDASIAYVAPISDDLEDKRIYKFLDTIGTKECRKDIFTYQKFMLKKKDKVLDRLQWFVKGKGLEFDYLGDLETAYEYAMLEYPFSVWQWGTPCEDIPDNKDLDTYIEHLLEVVGLDFYDDKTNEFFAAHYYQASTQMGYYGFQTLRYSRWLDKLGRNPSASFPPKDSNPVYDNSLAKDVMKWLNKDGNDLLYINGLMDTWASNRVIPSKKVNSKAFNLAKASHGDARIANMSPEMKVEFTEALEALINRKVDLSTLEEEK